MSRSIGAGSRRCLGLLCLFGLFFSYGCGNSIVRVYDPLAPKAPVSRGKTLSLKDTVDARPWHERMAIQSSVTPYWGPKAWKYGDLEEDLEEILLLELRRSGTFEYVCSPPVEEGYFLRVDLQSLSVKDEMMWWSDVLPLYIVGSLLFVPMRKVEAEAVIRYRLYEEGDLLLDRETRGMSRTRIPPEFLTAHSRTKAASSALGEGIAKMVCRIQSELGQGDGTEG